MLYAIYEWSNHVKSHFGNILSTERSFPLSIFLISRKILWCNVVQSKHQFSCLHGDKLETGIIFTYSLGVYFFFFYCEWYKHLSFYTLHTWKTLNTTPILCPLLAPLILWRSTHNCFHKTSCISRSVWHTDTWGCLLER